MIWWNNCQYISGIFSVSPESFDHDLDFYSHPVRMTLEVGQQTVWFAWGKMLPHMFWLLLTTQWQRFPIIFVRSKKNLGNIWNGGSTEVWSLFMPFGTITFCFRKSFFAENPETSQAWVRSNEISDKLITTPPLKKYNIQIPAQPITFQAGFQGGCNDWKAVNHTWSGEIV